MKFCPDCQIGFPNTAEQCPTHGSYLSEAVDLRPGMLIRSTYRIVRKLGEGGFGAVYHAEHTLMEEPRALKFLSSRWSYDADFVGRFRREVRTLRQVRHRNVVDCGDLERAEDETLFFAMEYVNGPDLRTFLSEASGPLDVPQVLDMTRGIAEGLGAAHAKGMVHRDIKPGNILLARGQDGYVPKIADFGIVATKEGNTLYTQVGGTLLSVGYAAPEQWLGMSSAELDGRTDLYALGGMLFEMLTGRAVFQAESYEGWSRHHLQTLPASPSSLRPDIAAWHGLDALVVRLLAKDRDDRPKDVGEVLRALHGVRYVASQPREQTRLEPPLVRSATVAETPKPETIKPPPVNSKRGRSVLMGALVVCLLVLIAIGIAWQLSRPKPQPQLSKTPPQTSKPQPQLSKAPPQTSEPQPQLSKALPQPSEPLPHFLTLSGHADYVAAVAFSPDGHTLASGSADKTVKLWNVTNGKLIRTLGSLADIIETVAFSPNGHMLASGTGDERIRLWDVTNGHAIRTLSGHYDLVDSVAFSPDGHMLASGSWDKHIRLWDVTNGNLVRTLSGHTRWVTSVAFSPDGHTLASGSKDKTIKLWDVTNGELIRTLSGDRVSVRSVAFSPDGHTLASGGWDKTIKLWDVTNGNLVRTLSDTRWVESVVFSPDGHTLASGGWDATIKLWDVTK